MKDNRCYMSDLSIYLVTTGKIYLAHDKCSVHLKASRLLYIDINLKIPLQVCVCVLVYYRSICIT